MILTLFYVFATVLVLSALCVVTARNPVHAPLALVLSFFTAAMLWILIKAEFLGVSLVLIYVGAVMVLFLFVVMMLNIDIEEMRAGFWRNAPGVYGGRAHGGGVADGVVSTRYQFICFW